MDSCWSLSRTLMRGRNDKKITEGETMETLDLKKLIKFSPDKISRDMLSDKPEMRIALMCLNEGQKLEPHKAPQRLLMYVV